MTDLPKGALIVRDQSKGDPRPMIYVKFRDHTRERSPQVERRIGPGWLVRIGEKGAKTNGKTVGDWRERKGNPPKGADAEPLFLTPDRARERAPGTIAKFYAEREREHARAARATDEEKSVDEVVEEWLAWRSRDDPEGEHLAWKHAHRKNTENTARRLARELGRDRAASSVTDAELLTYLKTGLKPRRNGEVIDGAETSRKMRSTYSAALRGIFAYALRRGWIEEDPAAGLPAYRMRRKRAGDPLRRHDYLTADELQRVLVELRRGDVEDKRPQAARDQEATMAMVMGMVGLRPGEALALLWEDVDLATPVMRIVWSRTMGVTDLPKSHAGRTVPMAPEVAKALADLGLRNKLTAPTDRVFAGPDGGHIDLATLRDSFNGAQDRAQVSPYRELRQLRNTFGTVCAAGGVPLRTLQDWMGHESITTTEIYASFMPREQDAAIISQAFAAREETSPGDGAAA